MRAMVLERPALVKTSPLKPMQVLLPEPDFREVRIRVEFVALSRNDLHLIEGELPLKKLPLIPGHQIIGKIDAVGRDCETLAKGQRVALGWLLDWCGKCGYCLQHQESLCDGATFTGWQGQGGFAEYCVAPEKSVLGLGPEYEGKTSGPLLYEGAIGYQALNHAGLPERGVVGLFGAGSSVHLLIQFAKTRGFQVCAVVPGEKQQAQALSLGADAAVTSPYELPRKLDSAIIFSAAGDMVPAALSSLKKGGTLVLAGAYLSTIPHLNFDKHLSQQRGIRSVSIGSIQDTKEWLSEAAKLKSPPQVTCYPLEKANQALLDLKEDRVVGSAVLEI